MYGCLSVRCIASRPARQANSLTVNNYARCRGQVFVNVGGPLRKFADFWLVSVLVINAINLLPTRAALVVVYLGGVLAAYMLLCEERKHPYRILARCMIGVYGHLWGAWKLITNPRWVIYRRAGLTVIARKRLRIAVNVVGGLSYLSRHMSEPGFASLQRLITLTSDLRRQTRRLHVRSKKAWYPSRVLIAYRVYRLSQQVEPAMERADQLMMAAMPMGLGPMLGEIFDSMRRRDENRRDENNRNDTRRTDR